MDNVNDKSGSPETSDHTQQDKEEKENIREKSQNEEIKVKENMFKGITDDISILSADLHEKMNSASAFVGKILLDSTDEEIEDDKEPKETFINSALNTVGKVASNVHKEMEDVAVSMSKDMDQVAKEITDVAKTVSKEMGKCSSSVSSSVALAMENVERVTATISKGMKESLVDALLATNNNKQKFKGDVVWSDTDSKHQNIIKQKVLALSHEKTNFTEAPWIQLDPLKGGNFDFDYGLFAPTASVMLMEDDKLKQMRYELVPKMVQEEHFWRNYFYRVQMIKQQFLDIPETDDNPDETCDEGNKLEDNEELDGFQLVKKE